MTTTTSQPRLTDHPQFRGLLADICDHPEDDDLRQVLADWLEDHDNPTWAEFIRVGILNHRCPTVAGSRVLPVERLRREQDLWAGVTSGGQHPVPFLWNWFSDLSLRGHFTEATAWSREYDEKGWLGIIWRRGLPDEFRGQTADWLQFGPARAGRLPLQAVRLWDVAVMPHPGSTDVPCQCIVFPEALKSNHWLRRHVELRRTRLTREKRKPLTEDELHLAVSCGALDGAREQKE
jgi:uncharacterized protein (TIGR02996 family)